MRNWTEAFPTRLAAEIEAFRETEGLDFELDDAELQATGRVVFRGTFSREGHEPIALEVRYPASFPYLRPEVFAPAVQLDRHQNPYRRNLCLLDRSTRHWTSDKTGAWLASERVRELLMLLEGDPAEMQREEAQQGEPASTFFPVHPGATVFIPEEMLHLPEDQLTGLATLSVGAQEPLGPLLRACMTAIAATDERGRVSELARVAGPLATRFPNEALRARWVRLSELPVDGAGAEDLFRAASAVPGYARPPQNRVPGAVLRILGALCKEEVRQGEWEDGWLFAVGVSSPQQPRQQSRHQRRRNPAAPVPSGSYVARGERLSPRDLAERIPTLRGMSQRKVALAGLGALGGSIAMELGRAQVGELRTLDHDHVEAGTIVRWPFGLHVVGHPKVQVLADHLGVDYPFTSVHQFPHFIGGVPAAGEPDVSESDVLTEFLDGADILLDATAETGISYLLSRLATEAGVPQVYVWATEGGWGGGVARVIPGETGCWYCVQLRIEDQSIVPPPLAGTGTVQPRGCAAPTWTGTSFDALPLVAQAVRTACFTLLGGRDAGNPLDVFICHQKAESPAQLTAPAWTSYALEPHPRCPYCAAGAN